MKYNHKKRAVCQQVRKTASNICRGNVKSQTGESKLKQRPGRGEKHINLRWSRLGHREKCPDIHVSRLKAEVNHVL